MPTFEIPKLLFAIYRGAQAELERALDSAFNVTYAYTLDSGKEQFASRPFDLIVCGIHFDECQMRLFLQHCRSTPALRHIPFLCVRGGKGSLPDRYYWRTRYFAEAIAAKYLDYQAAAVEKGHDLAAQTLREVIAACLASRHESARPSAGAGG